ncbi:acetylxylan esterase [Coraliomargarita algicola]|uniref:Acetylxylan esterase n=1 Tax=Coraliomargarita algicola TaxID=3092156 RepID=A0ABZ0RL74_9BACT|nr:acetylxylan esterase [Coraliomargarita sp. J2-16]WPJ96198.1 acetylxylan esterase [Coraliomargarita sp. J2-16]
MRFCLAATFVGFLSANAASGDAHVKKLHQRLDVNQDGLISPQEYQNYWKERFQRRDKDKNGLINDAELGRGSIKPLDRNRDGVISLAEEVHFRQKLFDLMDKDRDALLTLSEMNDRSQSESASENSNAVPSAPLDFVALRASVEALSELTDTPKMWLAEGFDSTDDLAAVYFDALDWKGQATKVFAWLGFPKERKEKMPAIVLVHGGGGTAFKEWVELWNARGYVAISIGVEGQTSRRAGKGWAPHEWAGPQRQGIYGDSSEALTDQWMYHAVADTILAHSLLRSLPEVDTDQVGIMGISWGGVITSTVIGIDARFVFAIPTYGCGGLATAANQYGRALGNNQVYQQVWDPILRLNQASMPTLWYSWPGDQHFPLDIQAANYAATPGPYMVSLVPNMGHSHNAAWDRPESYAFADSVTREGGMWCRQVKSSLRKDTCRATFRSSKPLDAAVLVSTVDGGVTGDRQWVETPLARPEPRGVNWIVQAEVPEGSTAWFINVKSGDLVASSGFFEAE